MERELKRKLELKDSYFDGFEYKGYRVKTKLDIEGYGEYRPLRLSTPAEVYEHFKGLCESDKERFYSILLDAKNKVIGVEMVSQGAADSAPVHPREAYKSALLVSASSVIFVHPHPSGDPAPSESDIQITQLLKEVSKLLCIEMLDHVIIGRDSFYSFSESGML